MTDPRRHFLRTGLAAACTLAAPPLFAKAPLGGGTALSSHRMKLGEFEVTTLLDGFIDNIKRWNNHFKLSVLSQKHRYSNH